MGIKDSSLWAREILSFLETAKNGSINGTAEANAMKQSNLSRTLKSLEEKLKCQLLERGYNGVRLTENGREVFKVACDLDKVIYKVKNFTISDKNVSGKIRLWTSDGLGTGYLSNCLSEFIAKYPDVKIEVVCSLDTPGSFSTTDMAVVYEEPEFDDGEIVSCYELQFGLFASMSYLSKFGYPNNIKDLQENHRICDRENYAGVWPQEDIDYYRLYYSGKQQITGELIQRTNVMLWNKIFKADLVRQYGIDFPTGYEYDDNCFYWQYMCVAKTACFLDEELYNYLRRNDSVMGKVYNRKNKGVYDSLYSLEYFYDFLRRNSLEKRYKRLFVDIYQNCWRFCTGFLDERQYAQAYKIFNRFRRILPPEVSSELKKHCRPRYLLRLGNFKLAEFICLNGKDGLTGCRLIDIRLVLFSKLTLFNLSLKNDVLRLKFCGQRILRLRQRK